MIEQGVYDSQTTAPLKDRSSREITSDGHEVSLLDVLTQLAYRKWLIAKVSGLPRSWASLPAWRCLPATLLQLGS